MFIQSAEAFCAWQKDSYRSIRDSPFFYASHLCSVLGRRLSHILRFSHDRLPWRLCETFSPCLANYGLRKNHMDFFSETDSHNYIAHRANKHTLDQTWMKLWIICCLDPLVFHFPCSEFFDAILRRVWLPREVAFRLLIAWLPVAIGLMHFTVSYLSVHASLFLFPFLRVKHINKPLTVRIKLCYVTFHE